MVKFSEKFGLDVDRKKLTAGDGKFNITKVVMKESKKDYKTKDGEGKITIVHIDGKTTDGKVVKFYSPNGPIVQACQDMLAQIGTDKSGALKEDVLIEEVAEAGEKGREYLYFK